MTDLEGLARALLRKQDNPDLIKKRLVEEILVFKDMSRDKVEEFAEAVLEEVLVSGKKGSGIIGKALEYPKAGANMGTLGVGCRGEGDFFVHQLLAEINSIELNHQALLGPLEQDDAGAVRGDKDIIVMAVDGTHSRLSDFPFLAGFHVTRASLRDVYVKGAKPIALFTDLHLADDGDVGKLFDFAGGIRTVSKLAGVPLVTGSTLRVGGDMVIGDRLVSCVGAVGVISSEGRILARRCIVPGDMVLMTEGAGGGTITTTAIYSGNFETVLQTLNMDFLRACDALYQAGLFEKIHALTDWTNGGLRGDVREICRVAKVGIQLEKERIEALLNKKVLDLLERLFIDYLGVSMDSLLIFCPRIIAEDVINIVGAVGVAIDVIGEVVETPKRGILFENGKEVDMTLHYRESAYTRIKQLVGNTTPPDKDALMAQTKRAATLAIEKSEKIVQFILQEQKAGEFAQRA
ncbi:MAG: AIR synthase-related protein [Candidatus Heimdallarchaeota archaeon]